VTGGGGAPLYSITEDVEGTLSAVKAYHFVELTIDAAEYQIKTIDIDGNIIDETAIHFASSF